MKKNLIGVLLLFSGISFSASSLAYLYQEGFEDGTLNKPTLSKRGACYQHSLNIVNSPAREGNKSMKVKLRGWEKNEPCNDWSVKKSRTELVYGVGTSVMRFPEGKEYWIGESMFVPKGDPVINNPGLIVSQIISSAGPELEILIKKGNLVVERAWSTTEKFNRSVIKNNRRTSPSDPVGKSKVYSKPIETGQWIDIVIHIKRSWKSDGILQIWKNGELIVDVKGPNAFRNAYKPGLEPHFKNGAYFGYEMRSEEYTLYFDAIRIGNANASYADVDPRSGDAKKPASPTELVVNVR